MNPVYSNTSIMKTITIIIGILVLLSGCEKMGKHRIIVSNKSTHSISVYGEYILPDTALNLTKPYLEQVKADGAGDIFDSDVNDEAFSRLRSERLTIFVIHTDTLNKYSWETIVNDYKILKRHELNYDELARTKFVLYYP